MTGTLASFICLGSTAGDEGPKSEMECIAREYRMFREHKAYQLVVVDSAKYRWTVSLCRMPTVADGWYHKVDSLFLSEADPAQSPHGNKLYRLFVRNYDAYKQLGASQPAGQALVKETWNVKEVVYDSTNKTLQRVQSRNDGKWYTPATVSQLFVMYKEAEHADNDKGWVYGIVDIENGKQAPLVLHEGKISSCIGCHKQTKYDRMFGVQ